MSLIRSLNIPRRRNNVFSNCRSFLRVHGLNPLPSQTTYNNSIIRALSNLNDSKPQKGLLNSFLGPESSVASESFKARWLMAVPAFATHMCVGSPYAWSLMADVLTRDIGVVASAANDWSLTQAALPLSLVFLMQGVTAAFVGKWQVKVGPRMAMTAASFSFGGGMMLAAAAIHFHSLPLLYVGYGFFGGTGIGLAYTPPVQTLMQWLPDKKGIASGLTIAGFGSGALVFTPAIQALMKNFSKVPTYLGPASDFTTKVVDGRLVVDVNGTLTEVIAATSKDLAKLPYDLAEGLYVVGTGSTGAAEAMAVMGAGYFAIMLASALAIKKPHPNFVPEGVKLTSVTSSITPVPATVPDISVDDAMLKPQFHLLGLTFLGISMGGMGLLSVAKPMMSEVFNGALPALVTSSFASSFLLALAAANLGGRLGWSYVSDVIGRRAMFATFTIGSIPVYLVIPSLVSNVVETGGATSLYIFIGCTAAAISFMGGVFALLPAYEADLFGAKNVGPIHGRMLLYSATASLAGPSLLLNLRSYSEKLAVSDLLTKIDPRKFEETFGAPMDQAFTLLQAKTVTISKLLALAPIGTVDPTPHLYDSTMYAMGGLMALATVSHALVRPLPPVAKILEVTPVSVVEGATGPGTNKTEEIVGDRQIKKK